MSLKVISRVGATMSTIVLLVGFVAWLFSRYYPINPAGVVAVSPTPARISAARPTPAWVIAAPEPAASPVATPYSSAHETIGAWRPLPLATGTLPYEQALLSIDRAPVSDRAKAQALFALLPRVPEDALAPTTEEALHWTRDGDYAEVAQPLLASATTHGAVLSLLFADVMTRPDAIALPALLQIASTPGHPYAASARDNLGLLLGQSLGGDWEAWGQAVQHRLQAKP